MNISCWQHEFFLTTPFISHRGSINSIQQFFIEIEWKDYKGYGGSLIPKEYTSDLPIESIQKEIYQVLEQTKPTEIQKNIVLIEQSVKIPNFIHTAVEMALLDLLGQFKRLPLYKVLGVDKLTVPPTSISISSLPESELLSQVALYKQWPILKFKITSLEQLNKFGKVRDIYPGRIWIDGNGSLKLEEALKACKILENYQVELFEQPVPKGEIIMLSNLKKENNINSIKLVADEDCVDLEDVLRLSSQVEVINIKLIKCRSIRNALTMINAAKKLNLQVMLGCKTESSIGVTAMSHLSGLVDYVDFDGHVDIEMDLFQGLVIKDGIFSIPTVSGIGVNFIETVK